MPNRCSHGWRIAHRRSVTSYVGPRSKSIVVGWDALSKYWPEANKLSSSRNVSLSVFYIHVNGNLAYEIGQGTGQQEFKDGRADEVHYIASNVYEKLDGRWLMISHHVQPKPQ